LYYQLILNREEILRNLFTQATEDTIETMPYTIQVFQDPLYDLKKSLTSDLDFLLGAFFAQVILFYSVYCSNKDIQPTIEESSRFNYELFSKAEEYKIMIRELMIIDNT
jgi:hypothetical protein